MSIFFTKDRRYSETYNLYYPVVFNTVNNKVRSTEDAEDIVQNVFIKYYEKMHDVIDARSWLFGTLRFEVMNYYQKKSNTDVDMKKLFEDASSVFINGFRDSRIILEKAISGISGEENRINF